MRSHVFRSRKTAFQAIADHRSRRVEEPCPFIARATERTRCLSLHARNCPAHLPSLDGVARLPLSEKGEVLLRGVGTLRYLLVLSNNSACQVPICAVAA